MANGMGQFQVPQLTKDNYDSWFICMMVIFGGQGSWYIVVKGNEQPQDEDSLNQAQKDDLDDLKKKDQKALSTVHQGLNDATSEGD